MLCLLATACGTGSIDPGSEGAPSTGGPDDSRPDAGAPKPTDPGTPDPAPQPQPQPQPPQPSESCDRAWSPEWAAFEAEVVRLVNEQRAAGARCGATQHPPRAPMTQNAELSIAARCHSLDMATQGYFSHDSKDGRSPWDRIRDAGYAGSGSGENIAAGNRTPKDAVTAWMESDGHCNNIMSEAAEIGVGYAQVDGSPFGHYWTQTFGSR